MNVLVCVAHGDDEVLGCGGTIAVHVARGDTVHVLVVADGVASRSPSTDQEYIERQDYANKASAVLGASPPAFLEFPDQRLDQIPLLEITQAIETQAASLNPEVVYTHATNDLNADHRLVAQAVLTAFRPTPGQSVKAIYGFETLSSTEWAYGAPAFSPVRFVDITSTLDKKIAALECYDREMRHFPHSRSYETVRALAVLRGSSVGLHAAEAFTVLRQIEG